MHLTGGAVPSAIFVLSARRSPLPPPSVTHLKGATLCNQTSGGGWRQQGWVGNTKKVTRQSCCRHEFSNRQVEHTQHSLSLHSSPSEPSSPFEKSEPASSSRSSASQLVLVGPAFDEIASAEAASEFATTTAGAFSSNYKEMCMTQACT